jgi:GNAT superfamily N-acetyltransferase
MGDESDRRKRDERPGARLGPRRAGGVGASLSPMPPPVSAAAAFGLSYRLKTEADVPFVERLYRTTREDELAMTGWPEEFKQQFIAQQQFAQNRHVELAHPRAEQLLIEQAGAPIGRDAELWLIDIALLPERRGRGIGAALLQDLLAHGRALGKPVGLTVVKNSPARRLYERLGFVAVADGGSYDRMEWRPDGAGDCGGG